MTRVSNMKGPLPYKRGDGTRTASRPPGFAGHRLSRLIIIPIVFTGFILAWLVWSNYGLHRESSAFNTQTLRVTELHGVIIHLDEVTTNSARMAAVTGDKQWEERYRSLEPKLDKAIKDAERFAPSASAAQAMAQIRL